MINLSIEDKTEIDPESLKAYFEVCSCGSNIFRIKVIPFGECGSDNQFICAACSTNIGGIYNDPLGEGDYDIEIEGTGKSEVN